jgi:peptide/nickel transport system ATP-binding protein
MADRVAVMYAGRIVEVGPVREVIKNARHPYTRGLMGSIPKVGHDMGKLAQIEGSMPRLTEIPTGCPFHPRCTSALERCLRQRPELMPVGGSQAACWLHLEAA